MEIITTYTKPAVPADVPAIFLGKGKTYVEILEKYTISYTKEGYYFCIGHITHIQGWTLHLSTILSQVQEMYIAVIPFLMSEQVPFKIIIDDETCDLILSGYMGLVQLGKVICIYPSNEEQALHLAKKLVTLTKRFKGPAILTDIFLGGAVYTRYGSCQPIVKSDKSGKKEDYIYNNKGQMVKDEYSIPFSLPTYISWPFGELANPKSPVSKKILKNIYKTVEVLKHDPRGNVYKAFHLKSLFTVTKCLIKQGNDNMSSDDYGRTIYDRLSWQQELYQNLHEYIPMPAIYDLFQEDGASYLVMEFIEGNSLNDQLKLMNIGGANWLDFSSEMALKHIDYLVNIATIIAKMHEKGYVHRDIAPGNFLIDSKEKIYLIDLELAYSITMNKPSPPFTVGTAGFMSIEQMGLHTPTTKEDIYGFGALMIMVTTGLTPVKFNKSDTDNLQKDLTFFIGYERMAHLIASCVDPYPQNRPEMPEIVIALKNYRDELAQGNPAKNGMISEKLEIEGLNGIISSALTGINQSPTVLLDEVWYSKLKKDKNSEGLIDKSYSRYPGIYEGISGVIYVLARAQKIGFNIQESTNGCRKGLEFIENDYLAVPAKIHPGLYNGTAGIAIAFAEGIPGGICKDGPTIRTHILDCLKIPCNDLNLANGAAGQGIAILQCTKYLPTDFVEHQLKMIVNHLLEAQQKDGSWLLPSIVSNNRHPFISLGYGIPGIIWFLLSYHAKYPDEQVRNRVEKALGWLLKRTNNLKDLFSENKISQLLGKEPEIGDERKGVILVCIKAYEILHDPVFKQAAESALSIYPAHALRTDFSQETGLSGMGEVYLEGWRVFNNGEWLTRARWIANVFLHTLCRTNTNAGYWQLEENDQPTADLMIGSSGIIHFLLRFIDSKKIGYRLLA